MDYPSPVDPHLLLLRSRHPTSHLEGGFQLCRLGFADARNTREFLGRASCKSAQCPPLGNQRFGHGHDICTHPSRAQENSQQLGISQDIRPVSEQALPGHFLFGKFAESWGDHPAT